MKIKTGDEIRERIKTGKGIRDRMKTEEIMRGKKKDDGREEVEKKWRPSPASISRSSPLSILFVRMFVPFRIRKSYSSEPCPSEPYHLTSGRAYLPYPEKPSGPCDI